MSASPERFIRKSGNKITSQPIKGTAPRAQDITLDNRAKEELSLCQKEISENTMIVDIVRNDLSRTAQAGSVEVEELCKVYTYPHVHQMISTISSQLKSGLNITDAIKAAFPMGSMTGAPKIKAMQLIELYENTCRGLYSGSIGFIEPNGDCDFNVVIRSLQYNQRTNYLSLMAGSAITASSEAEKEYRECLLKAEPLIKLFQS